CSTKLRARTMRRFLPRIREEWDGTLALSASTVQPRTAIRTRDALAASRSRRIPRATRARRTPGRPGSGLVSLDHPPSRLLPLESIGGFDSGFGMGGPH